MALVHCSKVVGLYFILARKWYFSYFLCVCMNLIWRFSVLKFHMMLWHFGLRRLDSCQGESITLIENEGQGGKSRAPSCTPVQAVSLPPCRRKSFVQTSFLFLLF